MGARCRGTLRAHLCGLTSALPFLRLHMPNATDIMGRARDPPPPRTRFRVCLCKSRVGGSCARALAAGVCACMWVQPRACVCIQGIWGVPGSANVGRWLKRYRNTEPGLHNVATMRQLKDCNNRTMQPLRQPIECNDASTQRRCKACAMGRSERKQASSAQGRPRTYGGRTSAASVRVLQPSLR